MTVFLIILFQVLRLTPVFGMSVKRKLPGTDDTVLGRVGCWRIVTSQVEYESLHFSRKKIILFEYVLHVSVLLRCISVAE